MQNGATINFSYCGITAIKLEEKYSFRTPTYLKFCQGSGWSLSSPNLTNSNFSIEISTFSSFHDATSFLFWQASKLATLAHWRHLLKNFTIISIWYTVGITPKILDSYSSLPHTLHCLIEDTCLQFGRTQFLLDAFYCTLDDHLKDWCVYYCTLDLD